MYVFIFSDGRVATSERAPLPKDFEDKTKNIIRCVPNTVTGGVIVQSVKAAGVFSAVPTTVVDTDQFHKVASDFTE